MTQAIIDDADKIIENAYAEMARGFFRLREAGYHQEAYDQMGVVLHLLMEDRQFLRKHRGVNP